jgi:Domain of unknown function (DUF4365)
MTEQQQKEQFSLAYVRAVAAVARVNVYTPAVDEDSIDLGFSSKSIAGCAVSPKLDAQVKCVTELVGNELDWTYPLRIKNYTELIGPHYVPRILIVVLIPDSISDWIHQTQQSLIMHKCGYWVSLKNSTWSENDSKVTIRIPKTQLFSPAMLRQLLQGGDR